MQVQYLEDERHSCGNLFLKALLLTVAPGTVSCTPFPALRLITIIVTFERSRGKKHPDFFRQTAWILGFDPTHSLIYKIDSSYVCKGEAVRHNCQTGRERGHNVLPADRGFCRRKTKNDKNDTFTFKTVTDK